MIKACFIVKYPPIQGGVSMLSYWLSRRLAERGHQIHVVTNAMEVEDDYRMYLEEEDRSSYEPRAVDSDGFVRVHHTQRSPFGFRHIPYSNPYVTKLSSVATQVIRRHECDVIFAFYLQPYGLAAHLASHWTGVPYMVKHAGSDLGRLMKQPGVTTAYREVVRAAGAVWTASSMRNTFLALGVAEEDIFIGRIPRLAPAFHPEAPPLDLNALLSRLAAVGEAHVRDVLVNVRPIDTAKPTIGIYGKVGEVKGSFDLLHALASLQRRGLDFNLVALTQGTALPAFHQAVRDLGLQERTWTLPFMPHWRVPGFIRACTAVCFLEREFPIAFHAPGIPREVLACGTCLVLSREIADKQHEMKTRFIDGENLLVVEDPRDHASLARQLQSVVEDPERAARIGCAGAALSREQAVLAVAENGSSAIELFEEQLVRVREKGPASRRRPAPPDDTRRIARLRDRLPWTSALLATSWDELVARYCETHPVPSGNQFDDAVRLCEFLEPHVAVRNGSAGSAPDALRYERHHNALYVDYERRSPPGVASPDQATGGAPSGAGRRAGRWIGRPGLIALETGGGEEVLDLKPVKVPGVHVETFARSFREIAKRAGAGALQPPTPDAQTILLFKRELNFVGVELKINEATKHFLELCDGQHTVRAAIAEMGEFYRRAAVPVADGELKREVLQMLRDLAGREIVRLLAER